ncbi:phosphopantetheine-binding protein, partial [Streptomyces sp. MZ04]|uniref:phosphopantetheine-binding protein n=1 Tax=Streptomyces sp. MZ04 TaxID=2559236 RepID=UPI001FD7DEBD
MPVPAELPSPAPSLTETERVLATIWSELLGRDGHHGRDRHDGRDGIGPEDNFFDIGGDSILSVGVAARAARAGISVTPQDLLRHPTLRGLAGVATAGTTAADIPPHSPA